MVNRTAITPAIAALAGRRIDAQDSDVQRFPLAEADHIFEKLLRRFRQEHVVRLVCSAACGADILALEAANILMIPTTIVLPFAPYVFRRVSVTDRPGNWGERFDRLVQAALKNDGLIELGLDVADENAYVIANHRIIEAALGAGKSRKLAFIVWEGHSRGRDDTTAEFLKTALFHGFEKKSIITRRRTR